MDSVALVHAAATWTMVGIIWFVQAVHYPLFALVGREAFPAYEAGHTRRISTLLSLPAGAEVVTGGWLFLDPPPGVGRVLPLAAGILLVAMWTVTALVQVRLHSRLSMGFGAADHQRLVATNWIRTGGWSVRGILALAIVAGA